VRIVLFTTRTKCGRRFEAALPTMMPIRARYPGTRRSFPTKTLLTIVAWSTEFVR
jgi:hypothetical protein